MRLPPLVLCYHAVSEDWTDEMAVPGRRLLFQVRPLLRLGYRGAPPPAAGPPAMGTLQVTLDDACRGVSAVLPGLRALEVPVSIFLCTGYADGGARLEIPELRHRAADRPAELATMTW